MSKNESISTEDMSLLFVTDSVEELVEHLKKHAITKFGLKKQTYKPKKWFE
ncbi:hypothetical protein [Flavobacterium glaciei]|uniref:hypothetical protein n=1 Tax=Flavobacterium glaciei TaxID=386300 RepID=UPI002936F759|nr:hypothetical protein [Flavobacterium glaciei]